MERVEFNYEEGRVDRSSAPAEPNPFDLNALQAACNCKQEHGGKIVAVSMGPTSAEATLREALARGADEAILLSGKEFAGSDTWSTSLALGSAIEKIGEFDLIFAGEKSVDGDTAQVGPEVARFLGVPHASFVSQVLECSKEAVTVKAESWNRDYVKRILFPGLITVTKDANWPELPTFRAKKKARDAPIKVWGADDLSVSVEDLGVSGSPTRVARMQVPEPKTRQALTIRTDPTKAAASLIQELGLEVDHE